jgi:hypothetical protein
MKPTKKSARSRLRKRQLTFTGPHGVIPQKRTPNPTLGRVISESKKMNGYSSVRFEVCTETVMKIVLTIHESTRRHMPKYSNFQL